MLTFLNTNSDAITAISSVVVAVLAVYGVREWKRQLTGKMNYEIARRYLISVLKLRDAIKFVRNPFIPIEEMQSALKEHELKSDDYTDNQKTNRAVYSIRWRKVMEARTNLEADRLEAEVQWGKVAVDVEIPLETATKKLFTTLKMYLDGHTSGTGVDNIIYGTEDDEFSREINTAITRIEHFLKPYLR